jgi:hypothetical protein
MKVESTQMALQTQYRAESVHVVTERWQWQAGRSGRGEVPPVVASLAPPRPAPVSPQADTTEAETAPTSEASGVVSGSLSPRLLALRDMLERLTGEVIRLYGEEAREAPDQSAHGEGVLRVSEAPTGQRGRAPASNGPSWSYERHEIHHEAESSDFAAQGVIMTADGRKVSFELSLSMQRSVTQVSSTVLRGGAVQQQDPLVINFDGLAAQLQDQRFGFDLNADGEVEQVALLSGERGYLALDRNGNGRVDDGRELFGPTTGQGFAELAQWDDDGNHWIDEADAIFQRLQVWMPQAQEGEQQALRSLSTVGVGALYLGAVSTPFELKGTDQQSLGTVRSSSVYLSEAGGVGTVQQIDLTV